MEKRLNRFQNPAEEIIKYENMAEEFLKLNYKLVSRIFNAHVVLIDLTNKNIMAGGKKYLGQASLYLNKNMVPFDTKVPLLRAGQGGVSALTTEWVLMLCVKLFVRWYIITDR